MEREDNYTSGGALLGRPASSRKERVIKQTRLKEERRTKALARAAGHVAPDEVLDAPVKRNFRRTARRHVPKVITNLGVLPVRVKRNLRRTARKLVGIRSAVHPNVNNISRILAVTSLGSRSQASLPRASRPRASRPRASLSQAPRSQASRSQASRSRASPSSAAQFVLAPPTFNFDRLPRIPEDNSNMGSGVTSHASPHHYPTNSQPDQMAK